MSQLGLRTSQEPPETAQSTLTTFLDLFRGQMDGLVQNTRRKRTLKERLGFKGIGCCGPTWTSNNSLSAREEQDQEDDGGEEEEHEPGRPRVGLGSDPGPSSGPSGSGMNLATALAAERHYRTGEPLEGNVTPSRASLMRLLEEETAENTERLTASTAATVGNDSVCCVCMGRTKEERRRVYPMWSHFLQSVFQRAVAEPRIVSALQPFDQRDPGYLLK